MCAPDWHRTPWETEWLFVWHAFFIITPVLMGFMEKKTNWKTVDFFALEIDIYVFQQTQQCTWLIKAFFYTSGFKSLQALPKKLWAKQTRKLHQREFCFIRVIFFVNICRWDLYFFKQVSLWIPERWRVQDVKRLMYWIATGKVSGFELQSHNYGPFWINIFGKWMKPLNP